MFQAPRPVGGATTWLVVGSALFIVLLFGACSSDAPGFSAEPATVPTPISDVGAEVDVEYIELTRDVISAIGELTRIISGISIGLAGSPESVLEAQETVAAVKGSFEVALGRLESSDPPAGYEQLHLTLVDALRSYAEASAALLPDGETGEADLPRFQELMLKGGKNAHAAIAIFEEFTAPSR